MVLTTRRQAQLQDGSNGMATVKGNSMAAEEADSGELHLASSASASSLSDSDSDSGSESDSDGSSESDADLDALFAESLAACRKQDAANTTDVPASNFDANADEVNFSDGDDGVDDVDTQQGAPRGGPEAADGKGKG